MSGIAKTCFIAGLVVTVCSAVSCGGGGGGGPKGPGIPDKTAPDVPADMTPDVPVDPVAPDQGGEDPQVAPEVEPDVPTPDQPAQDKCDPACKAGEFCDLADLKCKEIACTPCVKSTQCGKDETCLDHQFADGAKTSLCSKACKADADCPAGFACKDQDCVPTAVCPAPICAGKGKMGDACDKAGIVAGCAACEPGLSCTGQVSQNTCTFPTDCVEAGFSPMYHPVCVADGKCAYSFCTGKCAPDGTCPDGFGPVPVGLTCLCYPVGKSKAGEACPIFNVNVTADDCGAKLTCLGVAASEESAACKTDADCKDDYFLAAGQCVDGHCGLSFCSPLCGKGGVCPDGFAPINVSGTCFCGPVEVGEAKPGDPCPLGDIHPKADHCAGGSVCFGFGGGEDSDDCSADKDCPLSIWNGNPTCVNGKCASSFCSPYCDAAGACPSGFTPLVEQIGCFCIPIEIGSSKAGEACPSGNTNPTADYCLEGLICLALTANEGSDPCTKDEDCPGSIYVGTPSCAKGKCTSSFCSAKCDEKGGCPLGFSPTLVGTEKACYCSPKFVGKGEAGAPCPAGKVNAGAEGCKAELDCVGSFSSEEAPDKCTTAADCPAEYKGAVDCVDGECASTFCAEACDADGKCPAGFEPWGDEKCFCAPVTCKKEDHKGCVEDKVHWFDSCGAQGEMVEDCTAGGKTCKDGACIG